MNEEKQDNMREKLQEEITGKKVKCPVWQVPQPIGTLSYLTRTGLRGVITIIIIIITKEGSPAHSNKKASIPPRAEPGTMQLHTTRLAD